MSSVDDFIEHRPSVIQEVERFFSADDPEVLLGRYHACLVQFGKTGFDPSGDATRGLAKMLLGDMGYSEVDRDANLDHWSDHVVDERFNSGMEEAQAAAEEISLAFHEAFAHGADSDPPRPLRIRIYKDVDRTRNRAEVLTRYEDVVEIRLTLSDTFTDPDAGVVQRRDVDGRVGLMKMIPYENPAAQAK